MNKLLISLLCLLFMAPALHSEPITPEQAQMAAANFTHKRQESTARLSKPVSATLKSTIHDADKPLAFIAELEPTGFLILSGDTDLQPVIAYSFRHAWNADTSSDNPLYHLVKHDLMLRRQAVPLLDEIFIKRNHNAWQTLLNSRLSKSAAVFRQWPEPGSSSTGGWLESVWTQHSPYNDFCPLDPVTGNRCVTGCVATALAQVVHYHRFIGDLSFDAADAYTTGTRKIEIDSDSSSCDFPSFPRLNDYLNDLKSRYFDGGSLTNRDKAALNFACGIAVKMNYTSSSSGAPSSALETALKHHFSYESADYISDLRETNAVDDFYYRLQENMMNAFPALLDIAKLNISMAHVIACDGYNSDNFYHLNFGWGSTSPDAIPDAWYALPHAMPAGYGIITGAVVNIHPGLWYRELSSNTQWIQIPPCTIGAESDIRSVTLRNNSDWNMTVHSAVTSAPFSVSAYTHSFSDSVGPFSLGPDEELTLYTRCIPDSVGKLDRALTVHASGENQYLNVHMTGYGIPETGTAVNPGPVSGTWDKARSPYYVCGNIAIEPGDILHIQPGVDIIFMGRFALTVGEQAQLRACGSRSDSIRFDAYDAQQGWSGIVFDQSAGNDSLCFCRLTHAVYIQETNDYGGALSIYNSSPVILNSCLRKNRGFYGGALYGDQAGPFLQNCVIDENQADECGGAFYLRNNSSPIILNTVICRNQANTNGALLTSSRSDAWFYNVTVTDHIDGRYLGGLIHLAADNTIKFANSILWTPEGDNIDIFMDEHNSIEFEYSNIRTTYLNQHWPVVGYPYEQNNIIWGPGNGSSAPLFTHADPFQYILQSGSPCIDAGNPGPAYNDEQDPENPGSAQWPARGGLRNDMGAYGGCDLQSVVPVELALFTAESAGSHVHLTWTTLSETNNYGFNIQRRTSDTPFQTIAFVKGQGTSTQPHHYSYQDSNLSPGMYEYRLKQIDADGSFTFSQITRISINTPQKFRLAQNYPNPFNTSTRFTYDIPCAAETRLFIYNLLGEQIRCLVNDSRQPGTYRVSWDGRDDAGTLVSSGCYYCRMQAAAFTAAVKLVLLR